MKRIIYILFTVISLILFLGGTIVSHHHHSGVACVTVDECHGNDPDHEGHNHSHEGDSGSDANCLAKSKFTPRITKEESFGPFTDHNPDLKYLPIIVWHTPLLSFESGLPEKPYDYGEYIITYRTADHVRIDGLRGPPSFLS